MSTGAIIGIDFDNTLACYDDVMHTVAVQRRLIDPGVSKTKEEVRLKVRQLSNGETEWRKLQAEVYGPRIWQAKLMNGVTPFFQSCMLGGLKLHIISHKTQFATNDETGTDLRKASVAWMKDKGFFDGAELAIPADHVHFEGTRWGKLERIRQLSCTHFIDDLEETFLEDSFPPGVTKILYAPFPRESYPSGLTVFKSWREISNFFFGKNS